MFLSVEVTTTVPNTTTHFASPAGPAGNSDTERQKTSNVYVKLRQMETMLLFLCTCT